jgi:hypothetical protein
MSKFLDETPEERILRRIDSCTYTLYLISEELQDSSDLEYRADLLVAIENFCEVASHVVDTGRAIAWQHTLTPAEIAAQEDNSD